MLNRNILSIGGLGLILVVSWVQYIGILPRYYKSNISD
jgi:hypothetical protein